MTRPRLIVEEEVLTEAAVIPTVSYATFDSSLVHGIAWTSGMKWLAQILSWVCTVTVARMLAPADFGLVGMAALYLELVTVISEMALGAAIVTNHRLADDQIAQLNTVSVLLGLAAFMVSCAAAIPLSLFFGVAELRWVVLAMSVAFIVTAFRAVPSALLERELQFRSLAVIEGTQAVISAFSVLVLALLGFHYWALVLGTLFGKVVWTAMVLARRRHAFAWPRFHALRGSLAFGSHLLVSRLSWYAQANGDFLVIGRVFGKELLGAYTMSFTLASLPTEKITAIVGQVAFPLFSAVQTDLAALRRYLLLLTKGLALLTIPLALGLALVADDLILAVLGAKWEVAVVPLRCLAFLLLIQGIVPLLTPVLNVTGESRYAMRVGIIAGVIMPLAFFVGSRWGIFGVAAVWVTVYPLLTLPLYWRVFKKLELPKMAYLQVLWPAASAALVMAMAVLALKLSVPRELSPLLRLIVLVSVGAAVYTSLMTTLYRKHLPNLSRALQIVRGTEVSHA